MPGAISNMVSGYASLKFGLRGPNISIASACSSASHSIGYSFRTIVHGDADLMLTGGSEICLLYTSPSPRDRQKSRMPSSA